MMLRQSPFRWLVLAGILLFILGYLIDVFFGKKGTVHLILGMPVHKVSDSDHQKDKNGFFGELGFEATLDSLQILPFTTTYELQVREIDKEFSQEIHTNILPPSNLVEAFPLNPMKIRKIGNSDFRFRLKQFYPDFSFQYSYPENQDTIPPRAPGITLNLVTPDKEEVVTLRSDKPSLHRLDDVVHLGCALEFFWTFSLDSLTRFNPDSGKNENKIVFAGEDKKVYFLFGDKTDSLSIEINRFYAIPGKDSLGFTILQSFPNARFLKAVPGSKSEKLVNPVAEVEVWKLGGGAQSLYLYPNAAGRHGGEWRVPGSNQLLTCAISHDQLVNACTGMISITDSVHQVNTSKMLNGHQVMAYGGKNLRLSECDPDGIWANLRVWTAPGYYFKFGGVLLALGAFLRLLFHAIKKKSAYGASG